MLHESNVEIGTFGELFESETKQLSWTHLYSEYSKSVLKLLLGLCNAA